MSGEVSWAEFFFSFKGRVSRRSFWLGFLTILIVAVSLFGILALMLGTAAFELKEDVWHPTRLFKNIYWLMGALLYWPIFALIVKRLHELWPRPGVRMAVCDLVGYLQNFGYHRA